MLALIVIPFLFTAPADDSIGPRQAHPCAYYEAIACSNDTCTARNVTNQTGGQAIPKSPGIPDTIWISFAVPSANYVVYVRGVDVVGNRAPWSNAARVVYPARTDTLSAWVNRWKGFVEWATVDPTGVAHYRHTLGDTTSLELVTQTRLQTEYVCPITCAWPWWRKCTHSGAIHNYP